MRVVLDTNVIISAVLFGGRPASALDAANTNGRVLVVSDAILAEVRRVLTGKFRQSPDSTDRVLNRVRTLSDLVTPHLTVTECRDPDDNRILEAAIAGSADYIVSGDADLLSMGAFRGVQIPSVAAFLAQVDPAETP